MVLLGDGNGQKCRPGVRRGTVGRRNGAEVFPERVVMPRWATERGRNVARACGAAPLGYGTGSKCSPSVRRGAVRLRNGADVFPYIGLRLRRVFEIWSNSCLLILLLRIGYCDIHTAG